MAKDKPETPSEVKGSTEHNADDAAVNETSQKFDHPRKEAESNLERDEHYVSLKKLKESDKTHGVVVDNPNRWTETRGASSGYGLKYSSEKDIKENNKERGAQPTEKHDEESEESSEGEI